MGEEVAVAGAEDKAAAELEGILAELHLAKASGAGVLAGSGVVTAEKMEHIGGAEAGGAVGFAVGVNEQRKRDAGFLTENSSVAKVAKADGRKACAPRAEGGFVLAQLGNVLAAEDSTVVAEENQDRRRIGPECAELRGALIAIGKDNPRQNRTERTIHWRQLWTGSEGRSSWGNGGLAPVWRRGGFAPPRVDTGGPYRKNYEMLMVLLRVRNGTEKQRRSSGVSLRKNRVRPSSFAGTNSERRCSATIIECREA